ncbi:MAG: helix-turn-helix transcriptional regulator [Alphaproteobacteria bacterium]|nr:helix-turn-helix transcriptional regulator [Alphaproteobacteria bacterium]
MKLTEFRKRLKTAIKTAGGNKKVSELSDVPLGTLNNYIRGVSEPTLAKIIDIANICNVSIDWLAYGDPANNNHYTTSPLNQEALRLSLENIEDALNNNNRQMLPKDKAELLVVVYNIFNKSEKEIDNSELKQLLKFIN